MCQDSVRLTWPGKRDPLEMAPAPPLRLVEKWPGAGPSGRLLFGDNLAIMAALSGEQGPAIQLIYMDPPFRKERAWRQRAAHVDARPELEAFDDLWPGGMAQYLEWLGDRAWAAWRLLSTEGQLYLHLGTNVAAYARVLLDELLGPEALQNEIAWCYREAVNSRKRWNRKHDTILFYTRSQEYRFHPERVLQPYSAGQLSKYRLEDEHGPYRLMGRGIQGSPIRSQRDVPSQYEHIYPGLTYRHYLGAGTLPMDYWLIDIENQASARRTGYPTQKPEELLRRMLLASSDEGDLVADFCCGSATLAAAAAALNRPWICCDISPLALVAARRRLLGAGISFQVETVGELPRWEIPDGGIQARVIDGCLSITIEPGLAGQIGLWAVDACGQPGGAFRPCWHAARSRRKGGIDADVTLDLPPRTARNAAQDRRPGCDSPAAALPQAGRPVARILLWNLSGRAADFQVTPTSAGWNGSATVAQTLG